MGGQQHKVRTLLLEVQAPESSDTFVLHRRCSDVLHGELESVLKEVCDEFIPENVHLRLESLPLDLGDIMLEDLEEEMPKRTREKLQAILPDLLRQSNGANYPQFSEMSPTAMDKELLLSYLKTGTVPWWTTSGSNLSIETILDRMATSQADQLKLLLRNALKDEKCRRRMTLQCSLKTAEKVAKMLITDSHKSIRMVEFDSWLMKRMSNAGLVSIPIQEILERYLEFLIDGQEQYETWSNHIFGLINKEDVSVHKIINKVIESASTPFRQQLEESWKHYENKLSHERANQASSNSTLKLKVPLTLEVILNSSEYDKKEQSTAKESEQPIHPKELNHSVESEITSSLSRKWKPLLKRFSKEDWTSFLNENLMYGIGSTEWMDKITDDQLRELLKMLDIKMVDEQEVLFLIQLFRKVEIPGTTATHIRRWIWEKAFLQGMRYTNKSPLLHSVLRYIATNTKTTYQELVTNVYSAIQRVEDQNIFMSRYEQLLSRDEIGASSFSKKEERKPSLSESIYAWLVQLKKAMDQENLNEVEQLIYQMHSEGKALLDEKQRKALVRTLLDETESSLIQQMDHALLIRITYLINGDHVTRFIPLIEDLITVCLVYEKSFISTSKKTQSSPTALLIKAKEWLWKSIWTIKDGPVSGANLIKDLIEQIDSFRVKSDQSLVTHFARIVKFLEGRGHALSSSLTSFFAISDHNTLNDLSNVSLLNKDTKVGTEPDADSSFNSKKSDKTNESQVGKDDRSNLNGDTSIIDIENEELDIHYEENLIFEQLTNEYQPEEYDQSHIYFIDNAGLILIASFLPAFFKNLGLLNDTSSFVDEEARIRAIHLARFLVTGETRHPEHLLIFNKLICGLPLQTPLPLELNISKEEKEESEDLLTSVITNWSVLKNTSIEGLRTSFLKRQGKLSLLEDGWRLDVEERPYDMLLEHLPWGINICTLPWNDYFIYTEWHHN